MSKHILFFVHGMGEHNDKWHEAGLRVLQGSFKDYDLSKHIIFDDCVEAIPIVYNDKFNTWHDKMKKDFDDFKNAILNKTSDGERYQNEFDKVEKWIFSDNDNFARTHALDVVLYYFFPMIYMAVDVSVSMQILSKLKNGDYSSWNIVSHSLGTSVTHNVINSLYNPSGPLGNGNTLSSSDNRPRSLIMVANVSRVLQRAGAKVYESRVKPGRIAANRVCKYYLNCRHKFDPFCMPKAFNPDNWPDSETFNSDSYQHIEPSHLELGNDDDVLQVHNFDHYLKNPRVHVPIFRTLFGKTTILDDEFKVAKTEFDSAMQTPQLSDARKKLRKRLPRVESGMHEFIKLFTKEFFKS